MDIVMQAVPAGGKKIDTSFDGTTVRTDLLESSGGEGTGPEPLDLLFASLASCTANYATEFCRNRDIATDGLAVKLLARRSEEGGLFDDVALHLVLPEGFPEKYRKAIVRAAEKCTVKKHFLASIDVRTELADSEK